MVFLMADFPIRWRTIVENSGGGQHERHPWRKCASALAARLRRRVLVCQQIDGSRPLALHCIQFLQSEDVRKCKDGHQDGQHEINSPRHEIIAPSVRFAAAQVPHRQRNEERRYIGSLEPDADADGSRDPPTGFVSHVAP